MCLEGIYFLSHVLQFYFFFLRLVHRCASQPLPVVSCKGEGAGGKTLVRRRKYTKYTYSIIFKHRKRRNLRESEGYCGLVFELKCPRFVCQFNCVISRAGLVPSPSNGPMSVCKGNQRSRATIPNDSTDLLRRRRMMSVLGSCTGDYPKAQFTTTPNVGTFSKMRWPKPPYANDEVLGHRGGHPCRSRTTC